MSAKQTVATCVIGLAIVATVYAAFAYMWSDVNSMLISMGVLDGMLVKILAVDVIVVLMIVALWTVACVALLIRTVCVLFWMDSHMHRTAGDD